VESAIIQSRPNSEAEIASVGSKTTTVVDPMLTLRERLRLEPSASRGAGVPHKKSSSGVGPSPSKLLPTLLLELLLY